MFFPFHLRRRLKRLMGLLPVLTELRRVALMMLKLCEFEKGVREHDASGLAVEGAGGLA